MITKSVYLNRLVLQRASFQLNSATGLLSGKAHLKTHAAAQSLATKYSILISNAGKQLNAAKLHTNAFLSQSATPGKSVLSDDLQSIMKKKIEAEDASASSEEPNAGDNAKKGQFATLFSREHGWKVTLAFFGALMGGGAFYTLFAWGGPNLDENNKPVENLCCFFIHTNDKLKRKFYFKGQRSILRSYAKFCLNCCIFFVHVNKHKVFNSAHMAAVSKAGHQCCLPLLYSK